MHLRSGGYRKVYLSPRSISLSALRDGRHPFYTWLVSPILRGMLVLQSLLLIPEKSIIFKHLESVIRPLCSAGALRIALCRAPIKQETAIKYCCLKDPTQPIASERPYLRRSAADGLVMSILSLKDR